ncbi:UNVERIFIED_CONTAM: hypothetical protein K2H54_062168 [Gekko kuhli]
MHGMGPMVDLEDLHHWSMIGPDYDEGPSLPKGDCRRGQRWDMGVPPSLSGGSCLTEGGAIGDEGGSGSIPCWYDHTPDDCGASPVEIDVPISDPTGKDEEDDDEDDPWSKRLDVLERGQLYLQRHLEEAMRAIPEMVIRALAAERVSGDQQRDDSCSNKKLSECQDQDPGQQLGKSQEREPGAEGGLKGQFEN